MELARQIAAFFHACSALTLDFHLNFGAGLLSDPIISRAKVSSCVLPTDALQFQGEALLGLVARWK